MLLLNRVVNNQMLLADPLPMQHVGLLCVVIFKIFLSLLLANFRGLTLRIEAFPETSFIFRENVFKKEKEI